MRTSSPLLRFALKRLGYTLVVLLGVMVVVFSLVHLVPGDPIRVALGTRYDEQSYQALREASGLDRPIVAQFFGYVGNALTGDLGVSFRDGRPVTAILLDRLPASASLAVGSMALALLVSLPLGLYAGLREGTLVDGIVRTVSQFGVSIPDFWMALMLITVLSPLLGLPTSGYVPLTEDPLGWLRTMALPATTIGLVAGAIMTRYVRAAVLEVVGTSYVRTARSKGLSPRIVNGRHIVRNALVPVLTIGGIQMATMLGGVIVVEVVFSWPGLGLLVYDAVGSRDYAVIQGAVLLIAAVFLLVNLLVDLLYVIADPRIRLS